MSFFKGRLNAPTYGHKYDSWKAYKDAETWERNNEIGKVVLHWAWGRHGYAAFRMKVGDKVFGECYCDEEKEDKCEYHNCLQIVTTQWTDHPVLVEQLVKVTEDDESDVRDHLRDHGTGRIFCGL